MIQQADEDNHTRRDRCREAPGGRRGTAADTAGEDWKPRRLRPLRSATFAQPWPGPGQSSSLPRSRRASPSARLIRADFDPVAIARTYQEHARRASAC